MEGECLRMLEGHSGWVQAIAFDGKHIVRGSDEKSVQVWEG